MPDITMCDNAGCPKRENCHRFKAEPSPFYQSYSTFRPRFHFNSFVCDAYWPLSKEAEEQTVKEAA